MPGPRVDRGHGDEDKLTIQSLRNTCTSYLAPCDRHHGASGLEQSACIISASPCGSQAQQWLSWAVLAGVSREVVVTMSPGLPASEGCAQEAWVLHPAGPSKGCWRVPTYGDGHPPCQWPRREQGRGWHA